MQNVYHLMFESFVLICACKSNRKILSQKRLTGWNFDYLRT